MKTSDEDWAKRSKELFDESVDKLDAATLSRLNRGRHAALEAAASGHRRWVVWAPATGVAAAALVAAIVLQNPATQNPDVTGLDAQASDLEILLGEESIDMLEELEFYAWLDSVDLGPNGDS